MQVSFLFHWWFFSLFLLPNIFFFFNSSRRTGCPLGLTRPRLANGDKYEEIFKKLTQHIFQAIQSSKIMQDFEYSAYRQQEFASQVGGFFEAIRVTVTQDGDDICKIHVDEHNSKDPHLQHVIWLSFLSEFKGKIARYSFIGYWRKELCEHIRCLRENANYLRSFMHEVEQLDKWRVQPPHLVNFANHMEDDCPEIVQKMFLTSHLSSCFVEAYVQPAIAVFTACIRHFKLDFRSTVSLLMASAKSYHSMGYTVAACHYLLVSNDKGQDIGIQLLRQIHFMDREDSTGEKFYKPPLRFGKYKHYYLDEMPSYHKWGEKIQQLESAFRKVLCMSYKQKVTSKEYIFIHRMIRKLVPGVGDLMANHAIAVASIIGALPFAFLPMCHKDAKKVRVLWQ